MLQGLSKGQSGLGKLITDYKRKVLRGIRHDRQKISKIYGNVQQIC